MSSCGRRRSVIRSLILSLVLVSAGYAGDAVTWKSPTTGGEVRGELLTPAVDAKTKSPAIIVLKNLTTPRVGAESCDTIVADFVKDGYVVLVLDYAGHEKATSPAINVDILKLREDVAGKNKSL